jgi:periplasmic copper chaperone A
MIRRTLAAGALAAGAVVLLASPASAHVTVSSPSAEPGGFATLTFSVPNERDDASTTSLQITMPEDAPLAFVSVEPVPGWTVDVQREPLDEPVTVEGTELTEAVSTITWSGGNIAAGQFQRFVVSAGPLPEDATQLEFPAVQTYSDGEEVAWIEETPPGGEEPERPAPVLELAAASADGEEDATDDTTAPATGDNGDSGASATAAADAQDDADSARALGIVGIVIGAIGLLVALGALVAGRGRAPGSTAS